MMFATLDDVEGQVEMLVFKADQAESAAVIAPDAIVLVRGRLDHKDRGETKLVVQEAERFEPDARGDRRGASKAASAPSRAAEARDRRGQLLSRRPGRRAEGGLRAPQGRGRGPPRDPRRRRRQPRSCGSATSYRVRPLERPASRAGPRPRARRPGRLSQPNRLVPRSGVPRLSLCQLRATKTGECRQCRSFCDKMVEPRGCVEMRLPLPLQLRRPASPASQYVGCMQEVFGAEVELDAVLRAGRLRRRQDDRRRRCRTASSRSSGPTRARASPTTASTAASSTAPTRAPRACAPSTCATSERPRQSTPFRCSTICAP